MNWLDSARLRAALVAAGHTPATAEAEADCVLVNSCTVTAEADRKSRQAANAAGRRAPGVAVFGCGPRADAARWRDSASGEVFDSEAELLRRFGADPDAVPFPVDARTRLPVAVQTGCDNRCTFCITRLARGAHSSVAAGTVVEQVRQAQELGVKEVVLTGINLAAWGAGDSNDASGARLHALLDELLRRTAIPRIRLSSLGPQYLGPVFFEAFADPRVCPHLHLSVQSGSPAVLERMDRGHGVEEVLAAAEAARTVRPETAVTADLIVGFPGESEQAFEETITLARTAALAQLHVFPYSAREGTPAAAFAPAVPKAEVKARAKALREVGRELRDAFLERQWGREVEVLAEARGTGLTGNYIRVYNGGLAQGALGRLTLTPERLAEGR